MLKETETEETIIFFEAFLSLAAIQLKGGRPPFRPLARVCSFLTGNFMIKKKISTENFRVDYYLLLKYCRKQCALLSPRWAKSLTIKILHHNVRFQTCFGIQLEKEDLEINFFRLALKC